MKALTLFSGIGGFDIALERAGIEVVGVCEIDKNAQSVLRKHFPNAELFDDVRKVGIQTHGRKTIDVICGGFPCQDLSIAGKRSGLAGERSGLWFEFARVIDEIEPQWVVIENVPGLLSSDKGRDFSTIIQWLAQRGYGVAWRVLDAQFFGVAQRRRRVFIVASFGNGSASEILFESEGGTGDTTQSGKAGEGTAETFTIRSGKEGGGKGYLGQVSLPMTLGGQPQWLAQGYRMQAFGEYVNDGTASALKQRDYKDATDLVVWEMQHASEAYRETHGGIAPTLQSRMGTGGNNVPLVGIRRLTPTECERLQGFSDNHTAYGVNENGETVMQSDSARYKQLGNAVAVPVVEWICRRIAK